MTERRVEIEVEPLSDRRWAAIEERVLERAGDEPIPESAPPRRRTRGVAIAAMVAVAAGAIAAVLASWQWDASRPPSLATSRIVTAGDVAHTGAGDVAIEVAPRSSVLVLERARDAWLVSIEHGAARFRVPPRAGRPAFVVEGGLVRVEVVGTAFTVSREAGSASARVAVDEGTVRVTAGGDVTLVGAGEQWPAEAEPPVSTRAASRAAPGASRVEPRREVERHAPAPVPPAPRRSERGNEPESEDAPESEPEAAAPSPHERFARAEALERTAPETALREYAALARESGPWSANALFAQGRLELELHHRDRARALLERYLAQHPEGLNAEDARVLLERAR